MNTFVRWSGSFYQKIRTIGVTKELDDYERRKLAIFNILNCMGIGNGIIIPVAGLFNNDKMPMLAWIVAVSPAIISSMVLWGVSKQKYEHSKMAYFILYPFLTALAYSTRIDLGIELFFFVYGILAVFMLKRISNAVISFSFSILLYLVVFVFRNKYDSTIAEMNRSFFIFTHVLAVIFIFCCLYLFKTENYAYQSHLRKKNEEVEEQKQEIAGQVVMLEKQTQELEKLDILKNKLFSVISHDLKTPMYALRNMFRNIEQYDLPGNEIKMLIPDVVADLNYTTGLMENLLQWAKSQMQSDSMKREPLNITDMIRDVIQLLRLQANAKSVYVESKLHEPVYIYADRDMVNLVLRNLLSNAIKFTMENGSVYLGANPADSFVEVFVQDTGLGMTEDTIRKINTSNYFTTKGTSNESGTGIGLMLCKEFLAKNEGRMFVESEPGKGTVFSFTLPSAS